MRTILASLGVGLGLLMVQPGITFAQTPDAIIELTGGSIAAGIGFSWGSGTLIFQGTHYPLKVNGLSVVSVGAEGYTAAGSVTNLRKPEDINGIYSAVGAGVTLGGGRSVAALQNQNGVVIHLSATTEGLSLSLSTSGVQISLVK